MGFQDPELKVSALDDALLERLNNPASPARTKFYSTFGPIPQGMDFVDGATTPLTRRVTAPLGSTSGVVAASALDRCQRTIVTLPVPITRWRIKIANWNILGNTALTTPISGTGIFYGTPAAVVTTGSTNRWNGDYASAPAQAVGSFSVPTDGTDYVSPWIDAPLAAKTPLMLSLGFTTTATGTGVSTGSGCQVAGISAAGSAKAGDTVISGAGGYFAPTAGAYFDIRVEYEFVGTTPIGVFIGDSITEGTSDGDVFRTQQACLPHEAWPGAAGMQGNYATINLGTASANLATFDASNKRAWARADLATTVPDFAVIALGTNNIGAGYQVNVAAYVAMFQLIKSMGIKRIFVSTLVPRTDAAALAGTLAADIAVGVTSISSTVSIPNGTPIQMGWGRTLERLTTNGAPTGSGPYTIPLPATAIAHKAGDQVISGMEMSRQGINDWLRQVPGDVLGCLDFDLAMAFGIGSSKPDPRTMSADGVHPLRSGYQRMGTLAAPLGVTL